MLTKAVILSHSSRLGTGRAQQKPWAGANLGRELGGVGEPGNGVEMSQDLGRLGRLVLKGGAEAPRPGYRLCGLCGSGRSVGSCKRALGAYEGAKSHGPGG